MNIERFKQLADFLEAMPDERFDMSDFFIIDNTSAGGPLTVAGRAQKLIHRCGTAGCLVGWASALFVNPKSYVSRSWEATGQEALDLSYREAYHVFFGNWSRNRLTEITRLEAVAYLRGCVEHGTVYHGYGREVGLALEKQAEKETKLRSDSHGL